MTTLRNIVGGMDLEQTLTSRDEINSGLRGVLDEATGKWGIRVNRVEIKGIDPPPSIKDSMEKQMRADRDKRAVILTAEGQRQSAILTAEGNKQSAILNAEGDRESLILRAQADREAAILRAQGEGQAIQTVFQAIHDGQPDQSLLAYQYLQMMPKIAEGDANKVWVVPVEISKALEGLGSSVHEIAGIPKKVDGPLKRVDMGPTEPATLLGRRSTMSCPSQQGGRGRDRRGRAVGQPRAARRRRHLAGPAAARPGRRRHAGSPARAVTFLQMVAILLAGVAAGTINTVVGSGTLITFPTLLAFGIPPVTANVSNTIGPGARGRVSGAIGYRRELPGSAPRCCGSAPRRCSAASPGGAAARAARRRPSHAIVPVLIVLGCMLVVFQPRIAGGSPPAPSAGRAARRTAPGGCGRRCSPPGCTAATSAPPRACC